jgi:hypothetical protein
MSAHHAPQSSRSVNRLCGDTPDSVFDALNWRCRVVGWTIVGCLAEQLGL